MLPESEKMGCLRKHSIAACPYGTGVVPGHAETVTVVVLEHGPLYWIELSFGSSAATAKLAQSRKVDHPPHTQDFSGSWQGCKIAARCSNRSGNVWRLVKMHHFLFSTPKNNILSTLIPIVLQLLQAVRLQHWSQHCHRKHSGSRDRDMVLIPVCCEG